MRWVLRIIIIAILLLPATPGGAQEQLIVGNSYSGNIKLSSSNSGIYLPLPEGTWILAALTRTTDKYYGVPMIYGRFASLDEKRVKAVVSFASGNDNNAGWLVPPYCDRKDTFFLYAPDKRKGREIRCWGVNNSTMSLAETSPAYITSFFEWIAQNGLTTPKTMITVDLIRASGPKFLHATYFQNPEVDGFPPLAATAWQKDKVAGAPKRLRYLEDVKKWGEQWLPRFESAFAGQPQ